MPKLITQPRDFDRYAAMTTELERVATVLSLFHLLMVIWIQTPTLSLDPLALISFGSLDSDKAFNIGHVILFCPVIAGLGMIWSIRLLKRRSRLRQAIVLHLPTAAEENALSPSDLMLLYDYSSSETEQVPACTVAEVVIRIRDNFIQVAWYFLIPWLALCFYANRYFDLLPESFRTTDVKPAKAERIWTHLMSNDWWEEKAYLPNNFLENNPDLLDAFPYMYPPVNGWMQIGIIVAGSFATWGAICLYLGIGPLQPSR